MIPFLDERGQQKRNPDGSLRWVKTKADTELAECKNLVVRFLGMEYPVWKFIEMYCPIQTKSGKKMPFALNDAQIATYKLWDKQIGELGYIRCNEGKGRQMGSSTLICALYWTLLITNPGYMVAILADTEEKGKGLLRKYKFFYYNAPKALKDELAKHCVADSSTNLEFDFGGGIISGIRVIVANENAGASYTFQAIHASEVALWENISATLMALEQTVADEPYTCIIRETTARGPNEWKKYYESGRNNRSEFRSIFLAWYLIKSYRKPYDGHDLNEYERFLHDKAKLDLDQVQWWFQKFQKSGEDLAYMKQEYPSTESEMWESTAISKYDAEIVARRKQETEGKWLLRGHFECKAVEAIGEEDAMTAPLSIVEPHFVKDDFGPTKIFVEPLVGHPYVMVCDPSEQGDDYYAVHVFDNSDGVEVATYHKSKVDSDEAVKQMAMLLYYYGCAELHKDKTYDEEELVNRVYFASERQGGGVTINRQMKRFGFTVRLDKSEDESGKWLQKLGWRTTPSNRGAMIDESSIAFRLSQGRNINDYDTLCEMETFVYLGSKWQASPGNHDDLVMAYAGYHFVKGDFESNVVTPIQKDAPIPWNPCASMKNRKAESSHFIEW